MGERENTINMKKEKLSLKRQFLFFIPLAFTSIMMMSSYSLYNAVLSRLPSPTIYLSAFAVAKSVMDVAKSPILMVRQTVSSLVTDKQSYSKVKKFVIAGVSLIVLFLAFIALTGIGRWVFKNIMGIDGKTLEKAVVILRVFIFFPIASTLRNFVQGMVIKYDITPLFTIATVCRIIYILLIVVFVEHLVVLIPPAVIAGLIYFGSLLVEGLVIWVGVKLYVGGVQANIQQIKNNESEESQNLSYKNIFLFFYPLSITAGLKFLIDPLVKIGLGRTPETDLAISAFSVGWFLGLIFLSPFFMFRQLPIKFMGYKGKLNLRSIKKFGILMAGIMSLIFAIIAFSGIGEYILKNLINAPQEVSRWAIDVFKLMIIHPFIILARQYSEGILMKKQKTGYISIGKVISVITLIISLFSISFIPFNNPALIGIISILCAHLLEALYLYYIVRKKELEFA
ncbi:MAG: hypothetical protein ACOCQ5_03475 [Halanaerobiales bacterium]